MSFLKLGLEGYGWQQKDHWEVQWEQIAHLNLKLKRVQAEHDASD